MAETTTEAKAPSTGESFRFEPFTVEFGDDSNRTIRVGVLCQAFRGAFLRSNQYGKENGGRPMGEKMQRMPDIPGQRLAMRPGKRGTAEIFIFDPLEDDKPLLDRISRVLKDALVVSGPPQTFVARAERVLDKDEAKSLLLELRRLEEAGKLKLVKGDLPSEEAIGKMPGRELYDTWNNNPRKPRYVEDVEEWEQRLERA